MEIRVAAAGPATGAGGAGSPVMSGRTLHLTGRRAFTGAGHMREITRPGARPRLSLAPPGARTLSIVKASP